MDVVGRYRVEGRLKAGGAVDVLLARAEGPHGFERRVVLKVVAPEHRGDPEAERALVREARAYARLTHPGIVRLYDFFEDAGRLVVVLEHVDGLTLDAFVGRLRAARVEVDERSALLVGARLFAALAAAHAAVDPDTLAPTPLLHRDVNPTNVLLGWDGQVRLADFGVAKLEGAPSETRVGVLRGTLGYLAPEQAAGERVTTRSDVYAAALVVWELLARRRAIPTHDRTTLELLEAMARPALPSLDVLRPDVDRSVRELLGLALAAEPVDRVVSAEEVAEVLGHAAEPLEVASESLAGLLGRVRDGASERSFGSFSSFATGDEPTTARGVAANAVAALAAAEASAAGRTAPPSGPPAAGASSAETAPPRSPSSRPTNPTSLEFTSLFTGDAAVANAPLPVAEASHAGTLRPPPPGLAEALPPEAFAPWPSAPPPPLGAPLGATAASRSVAPRPRRRSSALVVGLVGLAGVTGGVVAAVLHVLERPAPARETVVVAPSGGVASATASATSPASAPPEAAPREAASAAPPPSAAAPAASAPAPAASGPAPEVPAGRGVLDATQAPRGHRLFVDGRVVGNTPTTATVACGTREVRLGSHGQTRRVDVPCGGRLAYP